jgi:hypothetical protein
MSKEISNLTRILNRLSSSGFYGEVTVKLEAGRIVHSKCTQSLKLDRIEDEPIVFEEGVIEIAKKSSLDK